MARQESPRTPEVEDFFDEIETRTQFSDVLELLSEWRVAAGLTGGVPALVDFEDRFAGPAGVNLMVLRDIGNDVFYERVGRAIPALFGDDPCGKKLADLPFRGAPAYAQRYRHCIDAGVPLFSIQHKVDHGIPGASERLILPVRLPDGAAGLLVYVRTRAGNYDLIRAVFNASQHGVFAVSAVRDEAGVPTDLEVLAVNVAGASLVGEAPDELIGRRLRSILPDVVWTRLWPDLSACLETGETRVFEINEPNRYMPGIYRVSSASLGDGLAITISDLTQLRRALQTLETQHAALAKVNAELRSEVVRRRRLETELKQLAATDPLTGIANRRGFTDAMTSEFDAVADQSGTSALILFDIDDFKAINDRYGHPVGDLVLQEISRAVSMQLAASSLFGRLGGEEFAVFLRNADRENVCEIAERLRKAIAQTTCTAADAQVRVTASFGVALTDNTGGSVETLISTADDALYAAKRGGRNRVECCSDGLWNLNSGSA